MKKLLAVLMSLVMLMALPICVNAAEPGDHQDIDVNVTYKDEVQTVHVYQVDLSWESMSFTYTNNGTKTWDAEKHEYVVTSEGSWDKTTAKITATNHSDNAVTVSFAYNDAAANDGVSGSLDVTSKVLASAVGKTVAQADSVVATLTITGEPTETAKVGTITVTIA